MGLAAFGDPQRLTATMDRLFHVYDEGRRNRPLGSLCLR